MAFVVQGMVPSAAKQARDGACSSSQTRGGVHVEFRPESNIFTASALDTPDGFLHVDRVKARIFLALAAAR